LTITYQPANLVYLESKKRKHFPKLAKRATCKLQLVHTDIAAPQKIPSLAGK